MDPLIAQEGLEVLDVLPKRITRPWAELDKLVPSLPPLPAEGKLKRLARGLERFPKCLLHMDLRDGRSHARRPFCMGLLALGIYRSWNQRHRLGVLVANLGHNDFGVNALLPQSHPKIPFHIWISAVAGSTKTLSQQAQTGWGESLVNWNPGYYHPQKPYCLNEQAWNPLVTPPVNSRDLTGDE
ncbi:uncharacterized protein BDR25DRAFT_357680 [Lindgomyces ingoldianus]|uniref:Uncharacterized protein n=1 Tax=Lindgomyces ingoldianus TaxID=673940 RepID=A0ACB6QMW2_9PLEO|nr:uncharacterized protein BDR25DRAFT_357680 [Lindgomyces ingoldianus]KAF2468364.1 hypothetical protein BDR25DRAFT_357680 [Lindgomyces ingoldianus]